MPGAPGKRARYALILESEVQVPGATGKRSAITIVVPVDVARLSWFYTLGSPPSPARGARLSLCWFSPVSGAGRSPTIISQI